MKNIRVSDLVYEMAVDLAKKNKPATKPERIVEEMIEGAYRTQKR